MEKDWRYGTTVLPGGMVQVVSPELEVVQTVELAIQPIKYCIKPRVGIEGG